MRRYFFVSGDEMNVSGGRAVIYEMVATLREGGFDAYVLHGSPSGHYQHGRTDVPLCYSNRVPKSLLRQFPRMMRAQALGNLLLQALANGPNKKVTFRPSDIVVLPERMLAAGIAAFPEQTKVLLSQNPFSYQKARALAIEQGHDPEREIFWNIGTAVSCMDLLRLTGVRHLSYIRVQPNLAKFPFRREKGKFVTYMPRKRAAEAKLILDALHRRDRLAGYELVAIDGVPQDYVAEKMASSLVFLSLMRTEALGFPGIEAMASGCIVIGYTGYGAREYFDATTGIPIIEGDTKRFVEAIEETIEEYGRSPKRLDDLRANASQFVHTRYGRDRFVKDVWSAFSEIENALGPK